MEQLSLQVTSQNRQLTTLMEENSRLTSEVREQHDSNLQL